MSDRLDALIARVDPQASLKPGYFPPVERWHPPLSGEIDILIDNEGVWSHEGRPFQRQDLVRLFSSILVCEDGEYFLVSPAEKWRINVEDVPFVLVLMEVDNASQEKQTIHFRTQLGDAVTVDEMHPIVLRPFGSDEQLLPYVPLRRGLMGRVSRSAYYQLVGLAEEGDLPGGTQGMGVRSGGRFFPLE